MVGGSIPPAATEVLERVLKAQSAQLRWRTEMQKETVVQRKERLEKFFKRPTFKEIRERTSRKYKQDEKVNKAEAN